jgi:sugar phosphate isomerase/epimerase
MTDGTGSAKDEHLVPGRGGQPCGDFLEHLADVGYDGHVVVEINTRKSQGRDERELDLVESLAFTRLHLASAPRPGGADRASA